MARLALKLILMSTYQYVSNTFACLLTKASGFVVQFFSFLQSTAGK